jgi:hypothetical protein
MREDHRKTLVTLAARIGVTAYEDEPLDANAAYLLAGIVLGLYYDPDKDRELLMDKKKEGEV